MIAEIGVNHNGNLDLALELVVAAAQAGANAAKFQTYRAEEFVSPRAVKAEYQRWGDDDSESQLSMLKRFQLSQDHHRVLLQKCKESGIDYLSSAFDSTSLEFVLSLKPAYLKLPSGELTNYPYLRRVGKANRPTLLSTGMSTLEEIEAAVDLLLLQGLDAYKLVLLHCTSAYPTPYDEVNLRVLRTLRRHFGIQVGLSDHSPGCVAAIAAVALGAVVIEKHLTLDRSLPGPDHRASLTPGEFTHLVHSIRQVEQALGTAEKRVTPHERQNRDIARKSLHLLRSVKTGEHLTEEHLTVRRPGDGISPMFWQQVLGRVVAEELPSGLKLEWRHFRDSKDT